MRRLRAFVSADRRDSSVDSGAGCRLTKRPFNRLQMSSWEGRPCLSSRASGPQWRTWDCSLLKGPYAFLNFELAQTTFETAARITAADKTGRSPSPQMPWPPAGRGPAGHKAGRDLVPSIPARRLRAAWAVAVSGYSYLRDSTGSICAARVAGTVPKITPTMSDTPRARMIDQGLMGIA